MKAATINDYDAPIEIAEIDPPELREDAVLIEVHAASLNPVDSAIRSGAMKDALPIRFPHVMGFDVSGRVIEIGGEVTTFEVGDAVFARQAQDDAGAIAEMARVRASDLAPMPANLGHVEAASVPLAGLTAWQALVTKGRLAKGDKVLIHGGSGGVGTLAIQIAKHFGAHVATTCSARHADLVERLGADVVIDYRTQSFRDELSGYDLVFDTRGGKTLEQSFDVVRKGGTVVSIMGRDEDDLASEHGARFEFFLMEPDGKMLAEIGGLIERGAIETVVGGTYAMERTVDAYAALSDGDAPGKVVVEVIGSA